MPGLDIVKIFCSLLVVADRDDELECVSAITAEIFCQLQDDREWRVGLCLYDRTSVFPIWFGRILASRVNNILDLVAASFEADADAIFMIHCEQAAMCAGKW